MRLRQLGLGVMTVFALGVVSGCGDDGGEPLPPGAKAGSRVEVFTAEGATEGEPQIVAVSQTDAGQVVFVNNQQVGETYNRVFGLTVSPDGKTVAFVARSGDKSFIMKNGQRLGQEYDYVGEPVLNPDGSRVACVVRDGAKTYIAVDGRKVGVAYDGEVNEPTFLPDGRTVACAVHDPKAGRAFVMKGDERVGDEYDLVSRLTVPPQKETLVFVAQSGNEAFLVRDGVPWGPRFDVGGHGCIYRLTFSPDGESVAFVVVGASGPYVVKDFTRQGGEYRSVGPLLLGESGEPFVYACRESDGWFLMWNGERRELAPAPEEIRDLVLSPSGESVACWVRRRGRWYVNQGGSEVFGPVDEPVALTPKGKDQLLAVGVSRGRVQRRELSW